MSLLRLRQAQSLFCGEVYAMAQDAVRRNLPSQLNGKTHFRCPGFFQGVALQIRHFSHPEAERRMLVYLPEYLDNSFFDTENSPIVCLRAEFYEGDTLSHRDFLGALMGAGIGRETVGDICVGISSCDFFVTKEIAPYIQQNFLSAGRTHLRLTQIPLSEVSVPEPETKEIRDTLASLRLDSVIAAGFRVGRSAAVQYVTTGWAAIDGLPCEKPDKLVSEGCKISVRGLGKIKLDTVNGQTKKGRISIIIKRYV